MNYVRAKVLFGNTITKFFVYFLKVTELRDLNAEYSSVLFEKVVLF